MQRLGKLSRSILIKLLVGSIITPMSHYIANLRDIEFCLFDLLGREKVMGTNPYGEVDRETAIGMLEEVKRLCENDLAASFVEGDRVGAILNKETCLLYTSPSPRDRQKSRMPSSA